ncbi:hypothetical protein ECANGB1_892 [Enterospora canceri]|uniref:Uncharacterized protein n=1 Tax=Enterospora canceri TaxID=1081671 RepID=A0A1Y1S7Y0_9MICR|nr:hypothetical protein ECANGB1_892 [Enterospora canceri]
MCFEKPPYTKIAKELFNHKNRTQPEHKTPNTFMLQVESSLDNFFTTTFKTFMKNRSFTECGEYEFSQVIERIKFVYIMALVLNTYRVSAITDIVCALSSKIAKKRDIVFETQYIITTETKTHTDISTKTQIIDGELYNIRIVKKSTRINEHYKGIKVWRYANMQDKEYAMKVLDEEAEIMSKIIVDDTENNKIPEDEIEINKISTVETKTQTNNDIQNVIERTIHNLLRKNSPTAAEQFLLKQDDLNQLSPITRNIIPEQRLQKELESNAMKTTTDIRFKNFSSYENTTWNCIWKFIEIFPLKQDYYKTIYESQ